MNTPRSTSCRLTIFITSSKWFINRIYPSRKPFSFTDVPASIMASATPTPFAPRHSTSVLEARSLRGLRRDAEGSQVAETIGEAHALPPRFSHGRRDRRIHAVGCCHIGGVAHICMGASAHKLHRHVEYPTVATR